MHLLKRFTLAACLSASAAMMTTAGVHAETTTDKPAMASTDKMSDADKRAKAADCSKQADAKKLHGSAREKFRAECKRK
jgi:hypothetical protein